MSQSASTTSGTAPQISCTVTNKLILPTNPSTAAQRGWNGEVVAISNTSGATIDANTDKPQLAAATDFVLLSFGTEDSTAHSTTSPHGNPLPVGKTADLTLPLNTALQGTGTNRLPYDLLFAQANNYFPVATIAGVSTIQAPAEIVLPLAAPHDTSSAANAYRFLQAFMADPCSPMAQQFTKALSADINAEPATGCYANVNAFFAQTDDFKNVDFSTYSAVSSYAFAYASIWANFQSQFSYNIYTTMTTNSGDDGDPNVKLSPLGTVVFSQFDADTPPLTDANAGYSMTWKPNGGRAIDLTFDEGQLISQADENSPTICLQTAFMDREFLTGQASDAKQATQALFGVIDGVHVVGSPLQLILPDSGDGDGGGDNIPIADAADADTNFMNIIVIVTYTACMVSILLWLRYRQVRNAAVAATATEEVSREYRKIKLRAGKRLRRAGVSDEDLEDYLLRSDSSIDAQEDYIFTMQVEVEGKRLNLEQAGLEDKQIAEQSREESNQLNYGNNSTLNAEVNQTNANRQQLRQVNLNSPDATENLENIQENINQTQATIQEENKALKLNSPQQNQLANTIIQERQQEQKISQEEVEEKVYENRNSDELV